MCSPCSTLCVLPLSFCFLVPSMFFAAWAKKKKKLFSALDRGKKQRGEKQQRRTKKKKRKRKSVELRFSSTERKWSERQPKKCKKKKKQLCTEEKKRRKPNLWMSRKSLKCQNDTQRALLHVLLASASERRKRLEALLSFSFSLFYGLYFMASRLLSPLAFDLPFVIYTLPSRTFAFFFEYSLCC